MTSVSRLIFLALLPFVTVSALHANPPRARWSEVEATTYMARERYPVGSNYLPADAVNELQMWQAATWDPVEIDKELGWAQDIGMTTMRVFLHDLLWEQDAAGLIQRMDQFLGIAQSHGIKAVFVLFDSCWDPAPKLGQQPAPIPGIHNSRWVQSPGLALADPSQQSRFKAYVKGVVGHFANDNRILAWDVWNEPDNPGGGNYANNLKNKVQLMEHMLPHVFEWARSVGPTQPLTSGVWQHDRWDDPVALSETEKIQLSESDVISFHDYSWPEKFEARILQLETLHRPVLCTEFMARGSGSTFDESLPIAAKHHVGAISWGLVKGLSQTWLPWDSWQVPYTNREPTVWFHDIFYPDGKPYRQAEVDEIRRISAQTTTASAHTANLRP